MDFRLDHVIIAVDDLARAVADYRALGFNVQIGGRHSFSTSENALIVFEDGAYIELIAWPEPDTGHRWYNELAKHGEGLMDFALLPEDVPRAIDEAKHRGLALKGPVDGGRFRPDGKELKWTTGRQTTFDLPFLCGDITARDLRVPAGDARRHANGAIGIATLVVAVNDIEASLTRYVTLIGKAADPVTMRGVAARIGVIALGETAIVLMTPSQDVSEGASPLLGELRRRLATRGEGPCALTIRVREGAQGDALLDPSRTHGVVIEMGGKRGKPWSRSATGT